MKYGRMVYQSTLKKNQVTIHFTYLKLSQHKKKVKNLAVEFQQSKAIFTIEKHIHY